MLGKDDSTRPWSASVILRLFANQLIHPKQIFRGEFNAKTRPFENLPTAAVPTHQRELLLPHRAPEELHVALVLKVHWRARTILLQCKPETPPAAVFRKDHAPLPKASQDSC